MATILLQAAGAYLGGIFGATGATLAGAAGGIAGYVVDRWLLTGNRTVEGARLGAAPPFTAEEGAPVPRLYGTARLGGTLIWATRFEETRTVERMGGKGGPRRAGYAYFGNAAFALCEGPIAGVRRVWADGRELDLETVTMRVHPGSGDQAPDPLIEARQGAGNAPAYRGIAYAVLERLPLEEYGNRLPQLQFEVLRPVGRLSQMVRAVALIPGSTEFGYMPGMVAAGLAAGESANVNRHVLFAGSDFEASIDELQAVCPGLRHVALVVSWFGDDLRAGECRIRPCVSDPDAPGVAASWNVGGISGTEAAAVSQSGGRPAYGGTPSDHAVVAAIRDLKARGLEVTLYPFVMMDVPAENELPDPHGGASQAAYPWRGRITCHPGPAMAGSADATPAARTQVEKFLGSAAAGDFAVTETGVAYSGDPDDRGYRRLVLHHARLAEAAGGVDAFLIGSELRGLTALRDGDGAFPFVEGLCDLAAEVRTMLGEETKLSYGADWSEYFGHQPGGGDVFFHLDPLWAHPAIDAVGIDNYMPLADWRDGDHDGSNPDGAAGPYDRAALAAAIAGGEGFDWHYPDAAARQARARAPIGDGAHAKPWVFRPKDLFGWWSNEHFDRAAGVEAAEPTQWVPRSKPFWFTELGCPACDKGPNQPNVFFDPKSSESFLPHFSGGGRSDLAQRRFLEAHLERWDEDGPGFSEEANPASDLFDGRMVDAARIYLWAWDCRPFPAFPLAADVWADGANWPLGHWLNGRLPAVSAGDAIQALLADHGLPPADVSGASGTMTGLVATEPAPARMAIEAIAEAFGLAAFEGPEGLVLRDETGAAGPAIAVEDLVVRTDAPLVARVREAAEGLPAEALLSFRDPFRDYQNASARAAHPAAGDASQESLWFPGAMAAAEGQALAADWLRRRWRGRETASFALPPNRREIGPGSLVRLPGGAADEVYLVTGVDEGLAREMRARRVDRVAPAPVDAAIDGMAPASAPQPGAPLVHFLDLPLTGAADAPQDGLRVAVRTRPWRSQVVFASPEASGFEERAVLDRPATAGVLAQALPPGPVGRLDRRNAVTVRLAGGALESVSLTRLLNGANAAAVRAQNGAWEVLQFGEAEEIEAGLWRLATLLRGQLGTGDATAAGAVPGAAFVLVDDAVRPAGLRAAETGLPLNWLVGPAGADFGGPAFASVAVEGGTRAALPYAPAHLRASRLADGGLALSWVRRGRIAADGWEAADIPLGEEAEAYRVEVLDGATAVRTAETAAPEWTYAAAWIAADFGGAGTATIRVAQLKRPGGPAGLFSARDVALG